MLEGVYFALSHAPVDYICSLSIIVLIASIEWLIFLVLDISNAFHNTILPNAAEIFYLTLPHIYLEYFKIKSPKHPLSTINQKELCIQEMKSIQGTKPTGKFQYRLLKSIIITVKIIRISYDHDFFLWFYMNWK